MLKTLPVQGAKRFMVMAVWLLIFFFPLSIHKSLIMDADKYIRISAVSGMNFPERFHSMTVGWLE